MTFAECCLSIRVTNTRFSEDAAIGRLETRPVPTATALPIARGARCLLLAEFVNGGPR